MKVSTWNVNGIRAREAQVLDYIHREKPDVLCLQEIKATPEQIPASLAGLGGYWHYWHGHKGYSGVGLHLSQERFPEKPAFSHPAFDHETRVVTAESGGTIFASVYVPNGGKDYPAKERFLQALAVYAQEVKDAGKQLVLCGDMNVALEERDVHPKLQNNMEIGQTAVEREFMRNLLGKGLTDLGRRFDPENEHLFTWWAPWRNMRQRNIGWRLDYVMVSAALNERAKSSRVFADFGSSDHAPVAAELEDA